jgi:3-dehydroquinate dehydratase-1
MKHRPLVCASLMEPSPEELIEAARSAANADLIEARIDALENPDAQSVEGLLRRLRKVSGKEIILTIRPANEGGSFRGDEDERKTLLEAGLHEAGYVDVELDAPFLTPILEKAAEAGTQVIVSHHDFQATPPKEDMLSLLRRECAAGADIAKLAVTANSPRDVLTLLEVTMEASKTGRVCTISMGEHGRLSRIAAPLFGSVLVYGYVSRPTAPGQMSVAQVRRGLEILGM